MPRYQPHSSRLERLLDGYQHPERELSPEATGVLLRYLVDAINERGVAVHGREQFRALLQAEAERVGACP